MIFIWKHFDVYSSTSIEHKQDDNNGIWPAKLCATDLLHSAVSFFLHIPASHRLERPFVRGLAALSGDLRYAGLGVNHAKRFNGDYWHHQLRSTANYR